MRQTDAGAARERQNSNTAEQKAQQAQKALPGSNVLASAPSAVDRVCLGGPAPLRPSQHAFYASLGSELVRPGRPSTLLPPSIGWVLSPGRAMYAAHLRNATEAAEAMTPKGQRASTRRHPWPVAGPLTHIPVPRSTSSNQLGLRCFNSHTTQFSDDQRQTTQWHRLQLFNDQ